MLGTQCLHQSARSLSHSGRILLSPAHDWKVLLAGFWPQLLGTGIAKGLSPTSLCWDCAPVSSELLAVRDVSAALLFVRAAGWVVQGADCFVLFCATDSPVYKLECIISEGASIEKGSVAKAAKRKQRRKQQRKSAGCSASDSSSSSSTGEKSDLDSDSGSSGGPPKKKKSKHVWAHATGRALTHDEKLVARITPSGGDRLTAAAALFESRALHELTGVDEMPDASSWTADRKPGLMRRCALGIGRLDQLIGNGKRSGGEAGPGVRPTSL